MTDEPGRLVELADERLVVVDDLVEAKTGELVGVRAELCGVSRACASLGSGYVEPRSSK